MQGDGAPIEASAAIRYSAAPWYSGLTVWHWRVLGGSYLGWVFDGYETFALIAVLPPALRSLLSPGQAQAGAIYAGIAIGITLLGRGIGGLAGGVLADYAGRKKMMLFSVFFYALFSGLTAFSTGFGSGSSPGLHWEVNGVRASRSSPNPGPTVPAPKGSASCNRPSAWAHSSPLPSGTSSASPIRSVGSRGA